MNSLFLFALLVIGAFAQSADVAVAKSGPEEMIIGFPDPFQYQINIANAGPNDGINVVMTDVIPSQFVLSTVRGSYSNGTVVCDPVVDGRTVRCTVLRLRVGDVARVFVNVSLPSNTSPFEANNTACVSSDVSDPDPANNCNSRINPVRVSADLSIDIQGPSNGIAGQRTNPVSTVRVVNLGFSDAQNVVSRFNVVSPLTFQAVRVLTGNGTCVWQPSISQVVCSYGTLVSGASFSYEVVQGVPANAFLPNGGTVRFNATVGSSTPDPNLVNNVDSHEFRINVESDVSVTKGSTPIVTAGQADSVIFTIVVENAGPSTAKDVVMIDEFPFPFVLKNASIACNVTPQQKRAAWRPFTDADFSNHLALREGVPCEQRLGCRYLAGNTLACDVETLQIFERVVILVTVGIPSTAFPVNGQFPWKVENIARVSSATLDNNPDRNSDPADVTILINSDVQVVKTGTSSRIISGDGITYNYTITTTNLGPSTAYGVTLADIVPPPMVVTTGSVQVVSGTGTCTNTGNNVACNFGNLLKDQSVTIRIPFQVPANAPTLGTIVNRACAFIQLNDTNPSNNCSEWANIVVAAPDVNVTKIGPDSVTVGVDIEYLYTITVNNNGPSDALNARLRDQVPPPFIVTSNPVPSQGFCIPNVTDPNNIDCDLGGLPFPSTVVITIPFRIPPNTLIPFTSNTASVFTTTPDRDPSNNNATFPTIIIREANLSVLKFGPSLLCAGGAAGTYLLRLINLGPSIAYNTTLVDDLPIELVPGPASSISILGAEAGSRCSFIGQRLTCNLGTLESFQRVTVSYIASVLPSTPANPGVINRANATSTTPDPILDDNVATHTTAICAEADVEVLKTGPVTADAGSNTRYTYQVTVINNGPADAVSVNVWDPIPTQFTPIEAPSDPACSYVVGGGFTWVNCTFARLTPGQSRVIVIPFTVGSAVPAGLVTNCAGALSLVTEDPFLFNNVACANTTVVVNADLSIRKTGPGSICAGFLPDSFFTVVVTNNGPAVATGVVVTDPLNPVFTPGPSSLIVPASVCSYVNGNQLSCNIGTLLVGQNFTIRYPVRVEASVPVQTGVPNTATVTSLTADQNRANNNSTATTDICASADMSVLKTGPAVATAGLGEYEYTIRVTNNGYSVARNVYFEDAVPTVFTVIGTPTGTAGVVCNITAAPQTFRCSWPSNKIFAVGESQQVVIRFSVPAATEARAYTNCATVFNSVSDPNDGNNNNCTTTQVDVSSDVSIVKSGPGTLCAGDVAGTYTLFVRNNGPAIANNVLVNDTIDSRFTVVAGSATPANLCSFTGQVLRCNLGTMAVNSSVTITYQIRVDASVPRQDGVPNTGYVSSSTPDGNRNNDQSTILINICAKADLDIIKRAPPTAVAGDGVTYNYRIFVANRGPADAVNAIMNDPLPQLFTPPAIQFVVASDGGSCSYLSVSPAVLQCVWARLTVGQNVTVTVPFTVGPSVPAGSVENCATTSSSVEDPNPSNNRFCESTVVRVEADVTILKRGPARVCAGDGITYLYTVEIVNNGFSWAYSVQITDVIPPQLTGLNVPAPAVFPAGAAACSYVAGSLACSVNGPLERGRIINVTFPFTVDASQRATSVINIARVSTVTTETNSNNNEATFRTEICAEADLAIVKTGPASVIAGNTTLQTFVLTARNNGPADAYNVTVTDNDIPLAAFNVQTATSSSGAACSISRTATTASVSCFYPVFRQGTSDVITVTFLVPASATPGVLPNCAEIRSSVTRDPDESNNRRCIEVRIIAQADLLTTKTGPAVVTAGVDSPNNRYVVTVTNVGGSDALESSLVDNVPFDFKVRSATPSKGSCTVGSDNVVRCNFGTLVPNESVTISYNFTVAPDVSLETRKNRACAATSTAEKPDGRENCAEVTTIVRCEATLRISKTDGVEQVIAGNTTQQTFVISVTNLGPSVSRDTVVTDTWPSQYRIRSGPTPSRGTCETTGTGFFCNFGTLGKDETVTVRVSYTVDANVAGGSVTNTACAQTSCGIAQVCASDTNVIVTRADLFVVKDDCVNNVTAGGAPVVFTITARNLGPSDAVNFVLSDTWPLPYIQGALTSSPAGATCTGLGGSFSCSWPTLPVGVVAQVTVSYSVASTTPEQFVTNCARVSSSTVDSNPLNNEDCDTNQIIAFADLEVTKKIDNADCITAGSTDTRAYTVVVTNKGPSTAYNVVVFDRFPVDLVAVGPPGCSVVGSNYTCQLGTLDLGATRTLVWRFTVDASRVPGLIENYVNVQSTTRDPELCNNNATVCSIICAQSDLSVTKTDNQVVVTAGDLITYTYTIVGTNAGPSWARNVTFVDAWPAEFVRTGISAPGGVVTLLPDGGFTVVYPLLRVGESYTIRVNYTVDACQLACKACNFVTISSPYEDPNQANNKATDCTDIRTQANLEVCKSDGIEEVTAGDGRNIQYTIQVANNGPSCAQKVQLVDHFPAAVRQIAGSIITSQGVCVSAPAGSQDFSCNLLTLRPGQTVTVYVNYTVPSTATTCTVCNYVTVSSITFDPELCNNDAKDCNALRERATLSITKSDGVTQIAGNDLRPYTYTIAVTNNGPSRASDVVVTDRWPAAFVQFLRTLRTNKGICVGQNRDFTCSIGALQVGETATVLVDYNLMQPPMCGVVTNVAAAFSPTDVECREAQDNTTVVCTAGKRGDEGMVKRIEPVHLEAVPIMATNPNQAEAQKFVPRVHKGSILSPRLFSVEIKDNMQVVVKNTFSRSAELESLTLQITSKLGKVTSLDLSEKSDLVETDCAKILGQVLHKGWTAECKIALKKTTDVASVKVDVRGASEVASGFHPMMGSASKRV